MAEQKLTHINAKGEAHMVDVSPKDETKRTAVAEGFIFMKPETLALIESGKAKKVMYLLPHALLALWRRKRPVI